jgi:hypothetical protein
MDRTQTVHEFGVVGVVGVLSAGIDEAIRSAAAAALSAPRAIQAIVKPVLVVVLAMLAIIMVAVAIVVATVAIIVAPLVATIIIAAVVAIRTGSPFGFLGVDVAVCYLYQFTNGHGPLAVQLSTELLVL